MKKFTINDETIKNAYNFSVRNAGIRLDRFKQNPVMLVDHCKETDSIIGNWKEVTIENNLMVAIPNFDVEDEQGKKIADKVERGFIKGVSMGILPYGEEPFKVVNGELVLWDSELVEISIVAIPSNKNAVLLYHNQDTPMSENEMKTISLNFTNPNKMNQELIKLSLVLGLAENSTVDSISSAIIKLKADLTSSENKFKTLELQLKSHQKDVATSLIDQAIELKLVNEELKPTLIQLFENDFENQKKSFEGLIAKQQPSETTEVNKKLDLFVSGLGSGKSTPTEKSYDELQKTNPVELRRIKDEEPEKYKKLSLEYAQGVRFVKN